MRFKCLSLFYCILINCLSDGQNIDITTDLPVEVTRKLIEPRDDDPMKVPVCCPINETYYDDDTICKKTDIPFKLGIEIIRNNDTHILGTFNNSNINPYYRKLNCSAGSVSLGEDEGILLRNGSYIIIFEKLVVNEFCIQSNYNETYNNYTSLVHICLEPILARDPTLYAMFISVSSLSAIALALGAIAFVWVLQISEDIHRKCILVYFITLFFTIICQLLVLLPVEGMCITIGYFFQFFYMMSMTWLTILCYDVYYTVRYFNEDTSKSKRLYWYTASSITVTSISFAVTITKGTPCIPNSFLKIENSPVEMMCNLGDECDQKRFFYIPFLEIALCIISLIITFIMIFRKPSSNSNIRYNYEWLDKNGTYKTMFSECQISTILALTILILHFILIFVDIGPKRIILVVFQSIQGIILVLLFVLCQLYLKHKNRTYEKNICLYSSCDRDHCKPSE